MNSETNPDIVLVNEVLNGNMSSYEEIVTKYQSKLYNFVYRLTLSKEDAEDILQETFIRAYKYLNKYNKQYCFSTWLFKIATNVFKSNIKKSTINKLELQNYCSDITKSDFNLEDTIIAKDKCQTVIEIINGLKRDYKIAITLRFFKELSYKEIALIMGKRENSVKTLVFRAKKIIGDQYCNLDKNDSSSKVLQKAK